MKKTILCLMTLCMTLAFMPTQLSGITEPVLTTIPPATTADAARATVLIDRLEEIKSMDKSEMTRAEKKKLRKEVRATNAELKGTSGGVYLSVGAIIIIILLLILLL